MVNKTEDKDNKIVSSTSNEKEVLPQVISTNTMSNDFDPSSIIVRIY